MEKIINYLEGHTTAKELCLFGTLALGSFITGTLMTFFSSL